MLKYPRRDRAHGHAPLNVWPAPSIPAVRGRPTLSGHSKWANIKHKKEKTDKEKGKAFTRVTREIMVAAREGGPDPNANFRLRMAIDKAREVNMPNENIQRAIKRGTGEIEGADYEEITYEGYGPGGVAILLNILTDNRNRTAGDIRYLFSKHGGNLGESGCVSWMFEQKGLILVERSGTNLSEDDLMMVALDAGAEDLEASEEGFEITTAPEDLDHVKKALEEHGVRVESAETTMIPKTTVAVSGKEAAQLAKLIDALDEHDDVQNVYTNSDMNEADGEPTAAEN